MQALVSRGASKGMREIASTSLSHLAGLGPEVGHTRAFRLQRTLALRGTAFELHKLRLHSANEETGYVRARSSSQPVTLQVDSQKHDVRETFVWATPA